MSSRERFRCARVVAVLAAVLGASFLASGQTSAAPASGIRGFDLGGLYTVAPGAVGGSIARAINDNGQVVGESGDGALARDAFSWTPMGGIVSLGPSFAASVNDAGQVVGNDWSVLDHAFVWTQSGGKRYLGNLGGGVSNAYASNQSGQVVGVSATGREGPIGSVEHAFLWSSAGGLVDLGDLGGGASYAEAVSDGGQVVGYSYTSQFAQHPFSWTASGGMVDLGSLGSSASASAVNDAGEVVGGSVIVAGDSYVSHAFSWTRTGGLKDLEPRGPDDWSAAASVNDAGWIAGASGGYPALWTPSGELLKLDIPAGLTGGCGALEINEARQIAGDCVDGAFGWTPSDGMAALEPLPGYDAAGLNSFGGMLNESGQVVGYSYTKSGHWRATLWQLAPNPKAAGELLPQLTTLVDSLAGLGNSLEAKLTVAAQLLAADKPDSAARVMGGFLAQVDAQAGRALTSTQAAALKNAGAYIQYIMSP